MRELARELLAGEEAWVVGGAVRDELLARPVVDLDIACRDPRAAAVAYARRSGGAPFPLSERHGAWRVALDEGRTVDFTPLRGSIEDDLATRDFTFNAIAVPLAGRRGGRPVRRAAPTSSASDVRHVSAATFDDDPLRLLRAVRFVDQFGFELDGETEALVRSRAGLVGRPAGERILAELQQLSVAGLRLLDDLGLLAPLGGSVERLEPAGLAGDPAREGVRRQPGALPALERPAAARLRRCFLRARRPADDSPRELHRFRRSDRAVGARGARVPGRARPERGRRGVAPARPGRAAASRRRARPAAGARGRPPARTRRRRSGPPARSRRARTRSALVARERSGPADRVAVTLSALGGTHLRGFPRYGHGGEEAGRTGPQGEERT